MLDERDISREQAWFYEKHAKIAVANLQKRNTNAQYVSSRQEALSTVIIEGTLGRRKERMNVVLVEEELGI